MDIIVDNLSFYGASGSCFYLCEYKGKNFITKLSFYKYTQAELHGIDLSEFDSFTDAEINILSLLKKYIINGNVTPCVLEIGYYKVREGIISLIPKNCSDFIVDKSVQHNDPLKVLCKYYDLVKSGLAMDKFAYIIMEECNISFRSYITKMISMQISVVIFKSLMFQLIYSLYAIRQVFPDFQHWDLHSENIMLKIMFEYDFDVNKLEYLVFEDKIAGETWSIPFFGLFMKIIDYGYASIPSQGVKSIAIHNRNIMFNRTQNDLLFTLHNIYDEMENHRGTYINEEILDFLHELDPTDSYIHFYPEKVRENADKIPTYQQMLQCKSFSGYKTQQKRIYHTYVLDSSKIASTEQPRADLSEFQDEQEWNKKEQTVATG